MYALYVYVYNIYAHNIHTPKITPELKTQV